MVGRGGYDMINIDNIKNINAYEIKKTEKITTKNRNMR